MSDLEKAISETRAEDLRRAHDAIKVAIDILKSAGVAGPGAAPLSLSCAPLLPESPERSVGAGHDQLADLRPSPRREVLHPLAHKPRRSSIAWAFFMPPRWLGPSRPRRADVGRAG
jgi:hypothetical protein